MSNLIAVPEKKKPAFGFILYPRNYVINNENPDLSYVEGVTQSGHEVALYLNPDEKDRIAAENSKDKNLPSIKKLGDKDFRARNICWADSTNSIDNPNGILLAEQVSPYKGTSPSPLTAWEAKWCSVIKEMKQTSDPQIGIGYLEINHPFKETEEIAALSERYKNIAQDLKNGKSTSPLEDDQKKDNLYTEIIRSRKNWFTGVILKLEDIRIADIYSHPPKEIVSSILKEVLDKYTIKGMYGGAIIRIRKDNNVIKNLCSTVQMRFDFAERKLQPTETIITDFWTKFERYNLKRILNDNSHIIEIIPLQRVNAAPMANTAFAEEISNPNSKYVKTYTDKICHKDPTARFNNINNILASRVAIRVAIAKNGPGEGNNLLSTMHAYSSELGNPLELNEKGVKAYTTF